MPVVIPSDVVGGTVIVPPNSTGISLTTTVADQSPSGITFPDPTGIVVTSYQVNAVEQILPVGKNSPSPGVMTSVRGIPAAFFNFVAQSANPNGLVIAPCKAGQVIAVSLQNTTAQPKTVTPTITTKSQVSQQSKTNAT